MRPTMRIGKRTHALHYVWGFPACHECHMSISVPLCLHSPCPSKNRMYCQNFRIVRALVLKIGKDCKISCILHTFHSPSINVTVTWSLNKLKSINNQHDQLIVILWVAYLSQEWWNRRCCISARHVAFRMTDVGQRNVTYWSKDEVGRL